MVKSKRSERRRDDDEILPEDEAHSDSPPKSESNFQDLDFVTRRSLQRKDADKQRRAKLRCFICGMQGHLERDCSREFPNTNRHHGRQNRKTCINNHDHEEPEMQPNRNSSSQLLLPPGFDKSLNEADETQDFQYFDASCDVASTLEYLQNGRGPKQKQPVKAALSEFHKAMEWTTNFTNFGGLISRSIV
jgi:hypothetical protein